MRKPVALCAHVNQVYVLNTYSPRKMLYIAWPFNVLSFGFVCSFPGWWCVWNQACPFQWGRGKSCVCQKLYVWDRRGLVRWCQSGLRLTIRVNICVWGLFGRKPEEFGQIRFARRTPLYSIIVQLLSWAPCLPWQPWFACQWKTLTHLTSLTSFSSDSEMICVNRIRFRTWILDLCHLSANQNIIKETAIGHWQTFHGILLDSIRKCQWDKKGEVDLAKTRGNLGDKVACLKNKKHWLLGFPSQVIAKCWHPALCHVSVNCVKVKVSFQLPFCVFFCQQIDINTRDEKTGDTALMLACRSNSKEVGGGVCVCVCVCVCEREKGEGGRESEGGKIEGETDTSDFELQTSETYI